MNALPAIVASIAAVMLLAMVPLLGVVAARLDVVFAVVIPYLAAATFLVGVVYRVVQWARSAVPFRIPTTCGQQKSLEWVRCGRLENPPTMPWTIARMALEVLVFRSLFRNTKAQLHDDGRLTYRSEKLLWAGGLLFHWTLLVVVVRHLRVFCGQVPRPVAMLASLDSWLDIGAPEVYLSGMVLLAAVTFLFLRRVVSPQLRYMSLPADYFPLCLIGTIALSGIFLRHVHRMDITAAKDLAVGLATFHPTVPIGLSPLFYLHVFLVCVLLVYLPFSKLMHMGGVFLSPTRNLANSSRRRRHVNPWDYPVKVHTYEEYEDEFRDKMKAAGLPLEKDE